MSKGKVAAGAFFGAIAGFVTGILLAPKSGRETREDLKEVALKSKDTVVDEAGKAKDAAVKVANDVKNRAEEVAGDVSDKAVELKGRTEQAIEGAKKGFSAKPKTKK